MGDATTDGRPLVFKTRDITSGAPLFNVYPVSESLHFVGHEDSGRGVMWMGVNEWGFGIVQADALNIERECATGYTNGTLINYSLQNIQTVEEFENLLLSTDEEGRSTQAIYAVIDAYGGGAVFEVANYTHQRYDPDSSGIIVKANSALIGETSFYGQERMNRAYDLLYEAKAGDSLDARFIGMHLMSDIFINGDDPYPLPFTGTFEDLPEGWVNTHGAGSSRSINSDRTKAAAVVQGVEPDKSPKGACLFGYYSCPVVSVPFVLFPAAHESHEIISGAYPSSLLSIALERYNSVFDHPDSSYWIDTSRLLRSDGGGIWHQTRPLSEWVFDTVTIALDSWDDSIPSADDLSIFQSTIIEELFGIYTDITLEIEEDIYIPDKTTLSIYPNPFNGKCQIKSDDESTVAIFNLDGRLIATLPGGSQIWNPRDKHSGLYVVKELQRDSVVSKKVVYLK